MTWRQTLSVATLLFSIASVAHGYRCGDGLRRSNQNPAEGATCPVSVDPCENVDQPTEGPVLFRQEPSVLTADLTQEVRVQELLVAGDLPRLHHRFDSGALTEWPRRQLLRTICGQPVSVFDLSWTPEVAREWMRGRQVGSDQPWIEWGELLRPDETEGVDLRLRFASKTLMSAPPVPVLRVNGDVQFTRHLVNLRLPDFGASRIGSGDKELLLHQVAQSFYRHFQDRYTVLAVYPHEIHTARDWAGFANSVRNQVSGINHPQDTFDCSPAYGSDQQLAAMHFYPDSDGLTNEAVTHELAHQYGHYFDWKKIAGIELPTENALVHAPLWRGPPTLVGTTMKGEYEIRPCSSKVTRTGQAPFLYHPLTLYGMGLLPSGDNPSVELALNQGQLLSVEYPENVVVADAWKQRSLKDIVRRHGQRTGPPIPSPLRWATVVVSRDRLLDPDELKFWNHYARQQGKPNVSWKGYGSIEDATNIAVKVDTRIEPLQGNMAAEWSFAGLTELHTQDWTEVELDQPLPLRWSESSPSTVDLSGRLVTGAETGGEISFSFYAGDAPSTPVREESLRIDKTGRFRGALRKADLPAGRYQVDVCLWPEGDCRRAGPIWTVLTVTP